MSSILHAYSNKVSRLVLRQCELNLEKLVCLGFSPNLRDFFSSDICFGEDFFHFLFNKYVHSRRLFRFPWSHTSRQRCVIHLHILHALYDTKSRKRKYLRSAVEVVLKMEEFCSHSPCIADLVNLCENSIPFVSSNLEQ